MSTPWSSGLMTGHHSIDLQHQDLFDMIDALGKVLDAPGELGDIKPLLQGLQQYVMFHFGNEEQMMRNSTVTADHIECHLLQHVAFADEIDATVASLSSGETARESLRKLAAFLQTWLVNHIQGTDRELVSQLASSVESQRRN